MIPPSACATSLRRAGTGTRRIVPAEVRPGYRWYALSLLALLNVLSYLDRNVIFGLFEPIKHELQLTDAQLGWLGSAYVLLFSVTAFPFGLLSDLRSRRAVVAAGGSEEDTSELQCRPHLVC